MANDKRVKASDKTKKAKVKKKSANGSTGEANSSHARVKTKKPHDEKLAAQASDRETPEEATAESHRASSPAKPSKPPVKRAPLLPRTFQPAAGQLVGWRVVDAANQPLGRLSTYLVTALMGKDKAGYSASMDAGDHVIVINARSVKLTGNKWQDKRYHYHTNYPGGIKTFTAKELLEKHPEWLIQWAVWGMLPKSKGHLARKWYKKLRVFPGAEHPHQAQQPAVVNLPNLGTWENA